MDVGSVSLVQQYTNAFFTHPLLLGHPFQPASGGHLRAVTSLLGEGLSQVNAGLKAYRVPRSEAHYGPQEAAS